MSTERKPLTQFIAHHGITMTADWAPSNPNMDDMPAGSQHYRYRFKRGRRTMTVPFSCGPAWARAPEASAVLGCLASDSASVENATGFDGWARDMGYEPDSRKAERIYKVCTRQAGRLAKFLGPEAYKELLWNTEEE